LTKDNQNESHRLFLGSYGKKDAALEVDFYLTGRTALSRCYLMHRYSDDLDFFLNPHAGFKSQSKKVISLIIQRILPLYWDSPP
jgi:predicted nucleotidyltransferase component of viral defense system